MASAGRWVAPLVEEKWFEITSYDPAASRQFYESLFGWAAQGDPDVYLTFPPHGDGDIPGGVRSAYLRDPDGSIFSTYRCAHRPDGSA